MASLRKQQASRANSLRSTGPKSTLGKRLASQNARTHGLSVALPDEVIEPIVSRLVPLIMQDSISQHAARLVATNLVEYERNLDHERQAFMNNFINQQSQEFELNHIFETVFSDELVQQESLDPKQLRAMSKVQRQERISLMKSLKLLTGTNRGMLKKAKDNSDRHYKRAANQLIKALRSA